MKKTIMFRKVISILLFLLIFSVSTWSQNVISVGGGSYAEYPPSHEYIGNDPTQGTFQSVALNPTLDVGSNMTGKPIPTNDWWTSVLYNENADGSRNGGNLWTYPLLSRANADGYQIGHRTAKDWGGDESVGISVDYLVTLTGDGFTANKTIAANWSDWHVDLEVQHQSSNQTIDVTLAQGMPFVWTKPNGFDAIIQSIHTGVRTYYDANGDILSFPATVDRFIIEYDGNLYGIHLTENTNIIPKDGVDGDLELINSEGKYIVFSALTEISDLNFLHDYAFTKPTDTKALYDYQPDNGLVNVTYQIEKTNIIGDQPNVLQGFIPHHYRGNTNNFSFLNNREYKATPRGTLKIAEGTTFSFDYEFNANLLPHFNEPITKNSDINPYERAKLIEMVDDYNARLDRDNFANGTYWGGKYLVQLIKYVLIAKEIGHPDYQDLLSFAKERIYDWLTYTPGETSFYYAYYPAWKALVGFNEEFFSGFFTDHHFHYGYLAHAGALLEMAEPGAMDEYWPMLTKVIKTYANWDRNDEDFPYMRTFSPWMGHSFANGLGNAIGNNQESTSEAMQSWAGMFMTGEITENTNMRDAAAYGYVMEGRAIADYWYNESGVFEEIGYDKPIVGILEMNRYVYGTFFGAQDTYIHGIQWLPITPAYGFWNEFLTTNEVNAIVDPIINNMEADLGGLSGDWMNVSWGFKLFFDPEGVTSNFDDFWNSAVGSQEYNVVHNSNESALTYYYAHNSQNLGLRQSNYRLSLPMSSVFQKEGTVMYVVYNSKNTDQTCIVYKDGVEVDSFMVPANTLITTDGNEIVTPPNNSFTIPGIIEAEDYKEGGEGVGYHDLSTGNTGGAYRQDNVDIENTGDVIGGVYNVGWIDANEWLAFDINATDSNNSYDIDFRVASPNGNGKFHLELDGVVITEVISVPNTGNWQQYETISVTGIPINSGNHELRIVFDSNGLNLNFIEFRASEDTNSTNCVGLAVNGQYSYEISSDTTDPTVTFVPEITGIGENICILYYGTSTSGPYPGYIVTPNIPFQINANSGDQIYFYYTYSLPTGGENNTAGSKHDFIVGSCNNQLQRVDDSTLDAYIYPNPISDIGQVVLSRNHKYIGYRIIDISGKTIEDDMISQKQERIHLDLSEKETGIYFLKLYGNSSMQLYKLLKK
ncbi:T9SS C-terminal target domain-containing protein [Aquimarina sp. AD1]|uniref:glycosyl hydrolase n=1 Tax=Aquimarina sp. (strain AD1) TaxID=1714848 RepID=UPI000E50E9EC|nr:glycosyl hydrolase [Aquimarina sp. AD1]AXT55622.1 T9SS C-terminal target domain-containing protein [Aquimarina sp. AD1]RKN37454.1 carbohydrate-binding protein [Aquimarina sp. AD1]